MITVDKKMVAVNMHPALYQSLTARAEYMKMSMSEVLEAAIVEWLLESNEGRFDAKQRAGKHTSF